MFKNGFTIFETATTLRLSSYDLTSSAVKREYLFHVFILFSLSVAWNLYKVNGLIKYS
jgi:hypothetical protein